jgi:hypothetical protein
MKDRFYTVDGWVTFKGVPRIQLEEPVTKRKQILTLPQVRTLIADILAEIQRLDSERNDNGISGDN